MAAPGLLVPLNQHLIPGVKEQDLKRDRLRLPGIQDPVQHGQILAASDIDPQGHMAAFALTVQHQLGKFLHQGDRQVIHTIIPHILQHLQSNGLACP